MTTTTIRQRLAELVVECSDGTIEPARLRSERVSLSSLGLGSLGQLRLVDAVESEYGVELDLDAAGWALLDDLDALAAHLEGA